MTQVTIGPAQTGRPGAGQDRSGVSRAEAQALASQLRPVVAGEVRFDQGSRALYATDGSNYRQVPIGVVVPRDAHDVLATLEACRRFGAPVLGRGAGTSLAGQCCNVAVVLDFSKYMNGILEVDPANRRARVQPGVVLDRLREAAELHHLTLGPDPATHSWCTIGGMIGNNSCGAHAVMGGKTVDNIETLEVVTYDGLRLRVGPTSDEDLRAIQREGGRRGELYAGMRALAERHADAIRARFPKIPRRVSGFNLDELLPENGFNVARALVGTESTCAITLEATVRLISSPSHRRLVVLGYPDFFIGADHVPQILEHRPIALEGFDDALIHHMAAVGLHQDKVGLLPPGGGWLLVELGADSDAEVDEQVQELVKSVGGGAGAPAVRVCADALEQRAIWDVRESGLGATAHPTGRSPNWEGWEDSAVDPARVGDYLRDLTALWRRFGYSGALYGHVGQGCVHTRNDFDLLTAEGIRTWRRFTEAAADLCVSYGGSLSGEHGDGQARGELLEKMFGPELVDAFRQFKALWDPNSRMNPGKVIDPYPLDSNLRLGAGYRPTELGPTHFKFPDDKGSFAEASLRCVGVGKCRRDSGGVMCPSYMVTKEEKHTTRGRARLLFEMVSGDVATGGWRNDDVREALDLCIACKGCKVDCPVSVDMATYKAEFLSHHYKGRLRPRTAYSIGLIYWAARAASKAPRLANLVTGSPVLAPVVKWAGGIAPERAIPSFATETFRSWFLGRQRRTGGSPVLLWPDTFTNFLSPEVAKAAVEVLEDAGYEVQIPAKVLCCGRPLYDFGMLDLAERLLRQVLEELRPAIAAGIPVVALEPSCLAIFRDELVHLFPADQDARRLAKQSFSLAELLVERTPGYRAPAVGGSALVQPHCHQRAVVGMGADLALLGAMGVDARVMDAGCCGLAGSFGFEADHYDISMQMGERVLLPAVRAAERTTVVLADGFSCKTQVEQGTGRETLHLAELLQQGLRVRGGGAPAEEPSPRRRTSLLPVAAGVATLALAGVVRRSWTTRR